MTHSILRRCLAAAFLLAMPPLAAARPDPAPLRVMTFNVRLPIAQDGANGWERRRDILIEVVAEARPDIVGTQELYQLQGDYLIARLPGYAWFGVDRRGGRADEHTGIFYRRDRLRLVEFGAFWLSDTPATPGSITWGNLYPRHVTWGLFEDRATGRRFHVLNAHLPYRPEDREARGRAAALLSGWIARLPTDAPVVLTGDFNEAPDGPVHASLAGGLVDVWKAARATAGPEATFHGFTGVADRRIDWILARGFLPLSARTITTNREGRFPSDHFPVLAVLSAAD